MDRLLKRFRVRLLDYCKQHSNSRVYNRVRESYIRGNIVSVIFIAVVAILASITAIIMDRNMIAITEIAVSNVFLSVAVATILIASWLIFTRCSLSKRNPMRDYILFYKWYFGKDTSKEWYYGEETVESVTSQPSKPLKSAKPVRPINPNIENGTDSNSKQSVNYSSKKTKTSNK